MFRWKLFLPLALAVSLLAVGGSHFWAASVDNRSLDSLVGGSIQQITRTNTEISFVLTADAELNQALGQIDQHWGSGLFDNRTLKLSRADRGPVPADLARQVELLVAQAAATCHYYDAAADLETLAGAWGYEANVLLWNRHLLVELDNGSEAMYLLYRLTEEEAVT